jgi:glycogen debranching enzyme
MTAPSPWTGSGSVASLADEASRVTVVEGSSFCLSDRSGDIHAALPQGLFVLDTRVLSEWVLHVDGAPIEGLAVSHDAPYQATFVGRVRPGGHQADGDLVVVRRRFVGDGLRERISVRNYGSHSREVTLELFVDADFADVFAVKESRVEPAGHRRSEAAPTRLSFERPDGDLGRKVAVTLSDHALVEPGLATWRVPIGAGDLVELCLEVTLEVGGHVLGPRFRCGDSDEQAEPRRRLDQWRAETPRLVTDHAGLDHAVSQAIEDLGALRIFDPEHPESPVIAAGAPWFMTLFGRDALVTSWMALLVDPNLAQGVLETLARLQGDKIDPATEEEPGRILHEVRFEQAASLALGGGSIYYGSIDATPLFVMLLGELRRWGLADDAVRRLLPHADRALAWIRDYGDRDGDGYVEYQRATPTGLANQGWKDSWDGISFADGRLPQTPIALCEVQGYTYAAYLARAYFALEDDDQVAFEHYRRRAADLKEAFNRDFWLADRGWYALGLDADKQPIDALASNIGHCLWTGIVDEDRAGEVAERLLSAEMFTGWGIRTKATTMSRYNPISYHNGSVWPHDTAIAAAGLMRYGFVEHAHRLIAALLDAAVAFGGRLPELFAGLDRAELATPAAYPTSCSPQAWAAASPLLLLRTLLRFDPWKSQGRLHVAPEPLPAVTRLELDHVLVAGQRVDLAWRDGHLEVDGLAGIQLDSTPRPPLSRAFQIEEPTEPETTRRPPC